MRYSAKRLVVAALILAPGGAPAKADLSFDPPSNGWSGILTVQDGVGPPVRSTVGTPSFPFGLVQDVADGASSAQSQYFFSADNHSGSFTFLLDQGRSGVSGSYVSSSVGFTFSTTEDVHYSLSGNYTMAGSGTVSLVVALFEVQTFSHAFHNRQESRTTPNESFTVGPEEGDHFNLLEGTSNGILLGGHTYSLSYDFRIDAFSSAGDPGATGQGQLAFQLQTIPAPSALPLVLIGLGTFGWLRRRLQ